MEESLTNYEEREVSFLVKRSIEEGVNQEFLEIMAKGVINQEYAEGKVKLDYEHKFPTGEIFKAKEDNEGNAIIVIEREGREVVSFNGIARSYGYKLAAPTLINSFSPDQPESGLTAGNWQVMPRDIKSQKYISIGSFRSPKDIFAFLHELGHARLELTQKKILESLPSLSEISKTALLISFIERNASAGALQIAREIKAETGIDLFSVFQNFDELKKEIYLPLLTYRYQEEFKRLDELFSDKTGHILPFIKSLEDMEVYKNYFDKGKLIKNGDMTH